MLVFDWVGLANKILTTDNLIKIKRWTFQIGACICSDEEEFIWDEKYANTQFQATIHSVASDRNTRCMVCFLENDVIASSEIQTQLQTKKNNNNKKNREKEIQTQDLYPNGARIISRMESSGVDVSAVSSELGVCSLYFYLNQRTCAAESRFGYEERRIREQNRLFLRTRYLEQAIRCLINEIVSSYLKSLTLKQNSKIE